MEKNLRIANSNPSLISPRAFTLFTLAGKFETGAFLKNSKIRVLNRRFNSMVP